MMVNRKSVRGMIAVVSLLSLAALQPRLAAQVTTAGNFARPINSLTQWSVQVEEIDPGDVNIEAAFRVAIYENLLIELAKTNEFKQVFRSGDRNSSGSHDLLILKTVVQKYTPGSETKRAVTTVAGATKLNVKSQLCTPDGKVVMERVVNGNVRFLGGNLRATHNLARNIANTIKHSTLPETTSSVAQKED
jgi:hypothetical protein